MQANRPNRLMKTIQSLSFLPEGMRIKVLSMIFSRAVPMINTNGVKFVTLDPRAVTCELQSRRKVHNHIKGIHAVAAALIAESATGFVMGLNVSDQKILLIKSMRLDYLKMIKGNLKATATLTEDQQHLIQTEDRGEIQVNIVIIDDSGTSPINAEMIWAWRTKRS